MTPADLRTWQARMNLTVTEACAALGRSPPTWYRWLRGDSPIPQWVAYRTEQLTDQLMKRLPPQERFLRAQRVVPYRGEPTKGE